MSRGGGGRGFGGGRSSAPPRPAAARTPSRNTPPPAPAAPAPPPAPVQGGGSVPSGLGSVVAEGMAISTGMAVANRAVDAVIGPRVIAHETVASPAPHPPSVSMATSNSILGGPDACAAHFKTFQDCLNSNANEITKCQFYMDMLAECRKSSGASLNA